MSFDAIIKAACSTGLRDLFDARDRMLAVLLNHQINQTGAQQSIGIMSPNGIGSQIDCDKSTSSIERANYIDGVVDHFLFLSPRLCQLDGHRAQRLIDQGNLIAAGNRIIERLICSQSSQIIHEDGQTPRGALIEVKQESDGDEY